MKRFTKRIIVCLLPILLSLGILFWPPGLGLPAGAHWKYENGEGGYRFGVDLVGGTILVYEVDETKTPENFKAEELANALKKRIDPADLYNITIRPVPGNPPRVEIVLPTGGRHQARAEQKRWAELLAAAGEKFKDPKGGPNPYADLPRVGSGGGKAGLIDRIVKVVGESRRAEAEKWVEEQTGGGEKGGGRRMLTSEEVENIKTLIERQGRLEFRLLANTTDDLAAINAARDQLKTFNALPPTVQEQLRNREAAAEPPPPPRNSAGGLEHTCSLPNERDHTYSWVEVGKSQLYTHELNSAALQHHRQLAGDPAKFARARAELDQAHKAARTTEEKERIQGQIARLEAHVKRVGEIDAALAAGGGTFQEYGNLFYVRKITSWARRYERDRRLGKEVEFFVLVRDPLKDEEITGDYLVKAAQGTNNRGEMTIDFQFNAEGGNRFWDVTTRNKPTGSDPRTSFKRQLAIIFDQQVISAPSLNEPIRTQGQISGKFTQAEINDLVRLLRAGALPATLKKEPVSQNSMGATLGADTIRKGTLSIVLAFAAVLLFMIFYYRFAGLVACVALFANLLLTVAFMVMVQAAFTLPGLAGLVLTLGMAVDANVLIYERLREERDRGASLAQALRNGYDRAFPTILDTHLTSIFTAIVLYAVGNDQLKGFGISLTVGLIISLFTSLYITRTIFEIGLYKHWFSDLRFFNGLVRLLHARFWDFMSIRYYWFTGTILLTILGAALFMGRIKGASSVLNIDFTGGVALTAQLAEPMPLEDLRHALEAEGEQYKVERLPDLSIEQIYVADAGDEGGERSQLFTIRTSLREVGGQVADEHGENLTLQRVFQYVNERLGDKLKRVNMKAELPKAEKGKSEDLVRQATLSFSSPGGGVDYASPAQVQLLLSRELRRAGQSPGGLVLERAEGAQVKDDKYSRMVLKLGEPLKRDVLEKVLRQAEQEFAARPQPERLEQFDAQLAANTQERALYAILASWAAILLYLWFRFGNWTFGLSAVLCLIHDLFFTLGIIAACHYVYGTWFGQALLLQDFKIDLPAVAALLTLVGYSVNDTIVVFDRVREVRGKNPLLTAEMINKAVNETLTRTILASMTVFLVVVVLYIFGGEGVKLFAFVMIIGVFVGTYSSIYIASPLLLIFGEGRPAPGAAQPQAQPAPTGVKKG
jgi:SecD/SecF fusion protein